ncbi:MAG: hypothetical protein M1829_006205 [Trizodia sp. TS-e1964]|nr:MAG: hypothetical protein M1829_006205 [Trizodia sp. TS-e1964]
MLAACMVTAVPVSPSSRDSPSVQEVNRSASLPSIATPPSYHSLAARGLSKRNPQLREVEALINILVDAWVKDTQEDPPRIISSEQLIADIAVLKPSVNSAIDCIKYIGDKYKSSSRMVEDEDMAFLARRFAQVRAAIGKAAGSYPNLHKSVSSY